MSKDKGRGRQKPRRVIVGARCRRCDQPFIYSALGEIRSETCPVCLLDRIASRCLDVSIRLALVTGELEQALKRVNGGEATIKSEFQAIVCSMCDLRDELALLPPSR